MKGDAGYKALKELVNIDVSYVRGEAIWTLAILASVPKSNRKIVKLFGWQDLLVLTESDDLEIKRAMTTLLGNLALFGITVNLRSNNVVVNPEFRRAPSSHDWSQRY